MAERFARSLAAADVWIYTALVAITFNTQDGLGHRPRLRRASSTTS